MAAPVANTVTVAATQFACGPEIAGNVERAERVVRAAAARGPGRPARTHASGRGRQGWLCCQAFISAISDSCALTMASASARSFGSLPYRSSTLAISIAP